MFRVSRLKCLPFASTTKRSVGAEPRLADRSSRFPSGDQASEDALTGSGKLVARPAGSMMRRTAPDVIGVPRLPRYASEPVLKGLALSPQQPSSFPPHPYP